MTAIRHQSPSARRVLLTSPTHRSISSRTCARAFRWTADLDPLIGYLLRVSARLSVRAIRLSVRTAARIAVTACGRRRQTGCRLGRSRERGCLPAAPRHDPLTAVKGPSVHAMRRVILHPDNHAITDADADAGCERRCGDAPWLQADPTQSLLVYVWSSRSPRCAASSSADRPATAVARTGHRTRRHLRRTGQLTRSRRGIPALLHRRRRLPYWPLPLIKAAPAPRLPPAAQI